MPVEMAAVTFNGAHTAESELSALRAEQDYPWLDEVAVLEHRKTGKYSVKATDPELYEDESGAGRGLAIGGGTGLLLGLIAGPLGLVFWGGLGALAGAAVGSHHHTPFEPLAGKIKDWLPRDSSALILLAETATTEQLIAAVGDRGTHVLREDMTDEQVEQLTKVAAPA